MQIRSFIYSANVFVVLLSIIGIDTPAHAQNEFLYWYRNDGAGSYKITRSDLDGNNVETVVNKTGTTNTRIGQIAANLKTGKIYYAERIPGKVFEADLDGTNEVQLAIPGLGEIIGLAVKDIDLYYSDITSDKIMKVSLGDLSSPVEVLSGVSNPSSMIFKHNNNIMYFSRSDKIFKIDVSIPDPISSLEEIYSNSNGGISSIDFNDQSGSILFGFNGTSKGLYSVNVDGSDILNLVPTSRNHLGVAFDSNGTKMIWQSTETGVYFLSVAEYPSGFGVIVLSNELVFDSYLKVIADDDFPGIELSSPFPLSIVNSTIAPTSTVSYSDATSAVMNITLNANDITLNTTGTATCTPVIEGTGNETRTIKLTNCTGDGTVSVSIAAGTAVDRFGNLAPALGPSSVVTVDNTPPGVTLGSTANAVVNGAVAVTVALSEPTGTFDAGDLTPVNATVGDFSGSGDAYGFTLTPLAEGAFGVQVLAGAFEDAATNGNTASNTLSFTYDATPPVFSALSATPGEASAGQTVLLDFAASEPIAGEPDVTVNGNPAQNTGKSTGYAYSYTVLPGDPVGPAAIAVSGVDAAGNAGALADNAALEIVAEEAPLPVSAWPLAAVALAGAALWLRRRR